MDRILEQHSIPPYELLDESFYQGFRNEVNEKRLNESSKLAEEIGDREFYGTYASSLDYLKTLKLVLGSTLETKHRDILLLRNILPLIKTKINFLDIGIGDGKITRLVGKNFQQITAIDINDIALNTLPVLLRNKIKIEKIHSSILDTALKDDFYDFCLLSHILYYIDPTHWLTIINKLFHATKPNGLIVIILGGDQFGKAELIEHFGGTPPPTDWLFQKCRELFTPKQVHGFCAQESFLCRNLNEMLHISGFMLYDAGVITSKETLTEYINKHFKRGNNDFCMTTQQKFILIHKS